ncbi:DinB family protein [Paenibacillus sp. VCA1]|uniref:DinB family protein n=1 Tax=Paenibacillus sp. VCA1 TaxID=3039148 RepID=UPI00287253A8|nr:DinB family protein [Paenibacillus sp. VCA1]MDR9856037.1 DinB family protein [Paenibacillus sp. VCA1]
MSGIDLDAFIHTHSQLLAEVRDLSEQQAKWKPAPQIWSVQEVVSHLVDHSFVISFRIRDILAGTAARLPAFDQDAWVSGQRSNEGRLSDILDAFQAILEYNSLLIGRLSEEELEKSGINFKGEPVSVKAIVQGFIRHVHGHLGQIERIKQASAMALGNA